MKKYSFFLLIKNKNIPDLILEFIPIKLHLIFDNTPI